MPSHALLYVCDVRVVLREVAARPVVDLLPGGVVDVDAVPAVPRIQQAGRVVADEPGSVERCHQALACVG